MSDETKTTNVPAAEPMPSVGGSYRRAPDGTLTPVEGPGTLPEHQPAKPAADHKPATQE